MAQDTVNIVVLVDVTGALASGTLKQNIYLVDNKKLEGSVDEGTGSLKTIVENGDTVVWNILSIECETYVTITDIIFENDFCKPHEERFEGSDVTYWIGKVKSNSQDKDLHNYKLKIKVGSCDKELVSEYNPAFILKRA